MPEDLPDYNDFDLDDDVELTEQELEELSIRATEPQIDW